MDKYEQQRRFTIFAKKFRDDCASIGVEPYHLPYTMRDTKPVWELAMACVRRLGQSTGATPFEMLQLIMGEAHAAHDDADIPATGDPERMNQLVYEPGPGYPAFRDKLDDRDERVKDTRRILFDEPIDARLDQDHPHFAHFQDR